MLEENLIKIIELRHDAPCTVLGPHYDRQQRLLRIHAFLPGAEQAWVQPVGGTVQHEMQRLHADGLFVVELPGTMQLDYQLVTIDVAGQSAIFPDPYALYAPSFNRADGQAFQQGRLDALVDKLGAHPWLKQNVAGVNFSLWAPQASRVSVVGTFNRWDGRRHVMERQESGVWELFIPGIGIGELYKYEIRTAEGAVFLKTDPVAFQTEIYPSTAALVCDLEHCHVWADEAWMARTLHQPGWAVPLSVYRVRFGTDPEQVAGYAQLLESVLPQLIEQRCTHVELALWAPDETVASYFTPNPRYGRPDELMAFIDACHQNHIGVMLEWIPAQMPREGQELTWFDGTRLYDADIPDQPERLAFNLERPQVRMCWPPTPGFGGRFTMSMCW